MAKKKKGNKKKGNQTQKNKGQDEVIVESQSKSVVTPDHDAQPILTKVEALTEIIFEVDSESKDTMISETKPTIIEHAVSDADLAVVDAVELETKAEDESEPVNVAVKEIESNITTEGELEPPAIALDVVDPKVVPEVAIEQKITEEVEITGGIIAEVDIDPETNPEGDTESAINE